MTTEKNSKKYFSLAFLSAIPVTFVIGVIALVAVFLLAQIMQQEKEVWALFALGFLGTVSLIHGTELPRVRIIIHELKHAIVITLTGNNVKNIRIGHRDGEVEYELPKVGLHYAPFIILAPYCFPLLSLPIFVACLILENHARLILALLLGGALGIDLSTAFGELHNRQTDFQKIFGGFIVSALYIAGVTLMWVSVCLLWVEGGRRAFPYAAYAFARIVFLN